MVDFVRSLFDTSDFVPRSMCGRWSDGLRWLHIGSDILIWLAYVSIPIVLAYFGLRRRTFPLRGLTFLFSAFILACGTTHGLDALIFYSPVYRLQGLAKGFTAVVSWATVIAFIPVLPRLLDLRWDLETTEFPQLRFPAPSSDPPAWLRYGLGVAFLALAFVVRFTVGTYLADRVPFIPFLLAVIFTSWYGGLGPALLVLIGGIALSTSAFVSDVATPPEQVMADQVGLGLFVLGGMAVTLLGESQRAAHRKASSSIVDLRQQRSELEAEVRRRREIEIELRSREEELRQQAAHLTQANSAASDLLAVLDGFLANAPIGMAMVDQELRFVRANPTLESMASREPGTLKGQLVETIDSHRGPALSKSVEAVRATNLPAPTSLVEPADQPPSAPFWESAIFPIHASGSLARGYGLIIRDITDRHIAQRRLQEGEARFRTLAEAMPQMVWSTRPDGWHDYFNSRWFDYTGLTPAESEGNGWTRPLHPDDHQRSIERWNQATSTGEPYEIEYRLRGRDGVYRWFLGRAAPQRDHSGVIVRWFGTCTDVDEQKRSLDDLRRSEERFRILSDTIPQMVWTATPTGEVEYYNPRWFEYTGLGLSSSRGHGWQQVVHPEDREAGIQAWSAAIKRGDLHQTEQRLRRADGTYRWHLVRGVPLRSPGGSVLQWVGTITDIDDQRRQAELLERLVRERTLELERSNRELEQFAYIASHDLQEPLRKIQAFGDRLQSRSAAELGPQGREHIDRILVSAGRMRNLINDLLSFSRVTTKARDFVEVDLAQVLQEVLVDLEEAIQRARCQIEVGQLPSIKADPLQMRQLLQNLVSNALKFRRPEVTPIIRIDAHEIPCPADEVDISNATGTWIQIRVEDNGIGFEEIYLDRIFQVFQRLHSRQEFEGTGVGLAICRKIVERHGGRITAQSSPGVGSTFLVELPTHRSS